MARYELEDPGPIALNAPYTFFMPFEAEIAAIKAGDLVKLCFLWDEPWEEYSAERMWVRVTEAQGGLLQGLLENEPCEIGKMEHGDAVSFSRHYVLDIIWHDPSCAPDREQRREYWERCLVDADVLRGDARVEYLYRETPDMAAEGDKYPDSGWRLRGPAAFSENEANEPPEYVALGAVLNRDDHWLALIDEPIGSRYSLDPRTQEFVRVVDDAI